MADQRLMIGEKEKCRLCAGSRLLILRNRRGLQAAAGLGLTKPPLSAVPGAGMQSVALGVELREALASSQVWLRALQGILGRILVSVCEYTSW